jgi:hypothetical protein
VPVPTDLLLVLLKGPVKSVCAAMIFHFPVLPVLELVSSLGRAPVRDFFGFIFPVQISVSFISPKAARFSQIFVAYFSIVARVL